jgi:DNA polymerase-3 subunit epsilon
MIATDIAVLDLEYTAGDPREGRIIEVGLVQLDEGYPGQEWSSLVQPGCSLPPLVRRLTGITDGMLLGAPELPAVMPTIEALTAGRLMVAHNVRADMTCLESACRRNGSLFERDVLCTEKLSRQLLPHVDHHNLGSLCRYFGLEMGDRHRALGDARATAALFLKLVDEFGAERVLGTAWQWPHAKRA